MNKLPASTGWNWIKQGFALFRKRPGQFSLLFTTYLMVLVVLMLIPLIGSFVPPFLAPIFTMVFMTACVQIDRKGVLNPLQLRASFQSPVSKRLFTLGAVYLVIAAIMSVVGVWIVSLMDGGSFTQLLMSQRKAEPTTDQNIALLITMLVFFLIFIPPLWFAGPLIVWQKMPVFQSMFYSFFAVFKTLPAFLVYFLSWFFIGIFIPAMLAGMLSTLVGKSFAMVLLFLLTIIMSIVLYCSFYHTYLDVFGAPDLPETGELKMS